MRAMRPPRTVISWLSQGPATRTALPGPATCRRQRKATASPPLDHGPSLEPEETQKDSRMLLTT
jgi:hypothetical protein